MPVAIATISADPISALEIPPPGPPKTFGGLVKKSRLMAGAAGIATVTMTRPSVATARSAAAVPRLSMILLTMRRRRRRPLGRKERLGDAADISARPAADRISARSPAQQDS